MRNKIFMSIIIGILFIFAFGFSESLKIYNNKIDPELRKVLQKAKPTDTIEVIVRLKAQPSLNELPYFTRSEKIQYLKTFTRNSQSSIIEFLRNEGVTTVEPAWLVNEIYIKTTKSIIEKLIENKEKEVDIIFSNFPIFAIPLNEVKPWSNYENAEWNIIKIKADSCWLNNVTGAGIIIANLDTGVDTSHPALKGKWRSQFGWYDAVNGRADPYDDNGHGTYTMGICCGGDGLDTFPRDIGVAPGAHFIAAKILDAEGRGYYYMAREALQWVAGLDSLAPHVINNSWSTVYREDTYFWPYLQNLCELGIIPVFALGNSGPSPMTDRSPGNYPILIGVGATNSSDNVSWFSSRGPAPDASPWNQDENWLYPNWYLIKPDITAPGENITSAWPGGGYITASGTSASCPHIVGCIALMLQKDPTLYYRKIYKLIIENADRPSQGEPYPNNNYGWGRVNAKRIIDNIREPLTLDIGVTSIINIPKVIPDSSSVDLIAKVYNFGFESIPAGVPIKLEIRGPEEYIYLDTDEVISHTLKPGETQLIYFLPNWVAPPIQGNYYLKIWTELNGDTNYYNDTLICSTYVCTHYYEPFTSLAFPPPHWSKGIFQGTNEWSVNTKIFYSPYASTFYPTQLGGEAWLRTPKINLTQSNADSLILWWRTTIPSGGTNDTVLIEVSTDLGNTYIELGRLFGNAPWWRRSSYNLESLPQNDSTFIRFRSKSCGDKNIFIDDIICPSLSRFSDVAAISFEIPKPRVAGDTYKPKASFYSNSIYTGPQTFAVTCSIRGSVSYYVATETIVNIQEGEIREILFDNWVPAESGMHYAIVYSSLIDDENRQNDTIYFNIWVCPEYHTPTYSQNFDEEWGGPLNPPPCGWFVSSQDVYWPYWERWRSEENYVAKYITEARSVLACKGERDSLITPRLNCRLLGDYFLSFWHDFFFGCGFATLSISTDDGVNWTSLDSFVEFNEGRFNYYNVTDLVAGRQNIRFAFYPEFGGYWCLDNFLLLFVPPSSLISPSDSAVLNIGRPKFEWSCLPNITFYNIQIDTSPEFLSPIYDAFAESTIFLPDSNLVDYVYFWRVRGAICDSFTNYDTIFCSWSNIWTFTIITRANISGNVRYYYNYNPVEGTKVILSGAMADTTLTDSSGYYLLSNLLISQNYVVTPERNNETNEPAVTAYDAGLILKHCVRLDTLDTLQKIAGNVSGDSLISSYDAGLVLQYSVGIIQHFPVGDWIFDPRFRRYDSLRTNQINQDYLAILYGDVSGNWPSGIITLVEREKRPVNTFSINLPKKKDLEDLIIENIKISEVPKRSEKISTTSIVKNFESDLGYTKDLFDNSLLRIGLDANFKEEYLTAILDELQKTSSTSIKFHSYQVVYPIEIKNCKGVHSADIQISYNPEKLKPIAIVTTKATRNFIVAGADYKGILRIGMASWQELNGDIKLLEIIFEEKGEKLTNPEIKVDWIFLNDGKSISITDGAMGKAEQKRLFSITCKPNPFAYNTQIRYTVPKETNITIRVFNSLGQIVKTLVDSYHKANDYLITWDGSNDFGNKLSQGIYFIQIETDNFKLEKKVMLLRN